MRRQFEETEYTLVSLISCEINDYQASREAV